MERRCGVSLTVPWMLKNDQVRELQSLIPKMDGLRQDTQQEMCFQSKGQLPNYNTTIFINHCQLMFLAFFIWQSMKNTVIVKVRKKDYSILK